ncbi:hypothetical protein ABG067_007653 [Albugo candida]
MLRPSPSCNSAIGTAIVFDILARDRSRNSDRITGIIPFYLYFPFPLNENRLEEYASMEDTPIAHELHIYTWPDATLREIADLIHDSTEEARKPNIRMGFSIVFSDHRGRYIMRKAGWVYTNRRKSIEEDKTLAQIGFQPGDFLDIALLS